MDMILAYSNSLLPQLISLFLPIVVFLIVSIATDRKKNKSPIWIGFCASLIVSAILYFVLPLFAAYFV